MRHRREYVTESFASRESGIAQDLVLDDVGARLGTRSMSWLDVDDVLYEAHGLGFVLPDGEIVWVRGLGQRTDECGRVVRTLRGAARRSALTQSALNPIVAFESRRILPGAQPQTTDMVLFANALVIEPRGGATDVVPLPLIREVTRDGHVFTLHLRGLADREVSGLGARTDEFAMELERARRSLASSTATAFDELASGLGGLMPPDGWALDRQAAGGRWALLRQTWLGQDRSAEASLLAERAGDDRVRMGMWTEGGTQRLPFLLAPVGEGSAARVAVEAVAADDRATFVFATQDVDRLNAALVLTAFRREAITLPDDALGSWAPAVRTQPVVQWMRAQLLARIVHDGRWEATVAEALG